jgi:hypothetical protein
LRALQHVQRRGVVPAGVELRELLAVLLEGAPAAK